VGGKLAKTAHFAIKFKNWRLDSSLNSSSPLELGKQFQFEVPHTILSSWPSDANATRLVDKISFGERKGEEGYDLYD
jgi:hypothetical protein